MGLLPFFVSWIQRSRGCENHILVSPHAVADQRDVGSQKLYSKKWRNTCGSRQWRLRQEENPYLNVPLEIAEKHSLLIQQLMRYHMKSSSPPDSAIYCLPVGLWELLHNNAYKSGNRCFPQLSCFTSTQLVSGNALPDYIVISGIPEDDRHATL